MIFSDPQQQAAAQRQALSTLRTLNVQTVKIHFSGGNDSGGADSIVALDANGNTVEIPDSRAHRGTMHDPKTNRWVQGPWEVYESGGKRPATPEEIKWAQVSTALEAPIYDRWGSFAGEFDVDGELTWDVSAGTHKLTGQESVTTWQDFSY